MESLTTIIEGELDLLRTDTSSDFSAIAWMDSHDLTVRWKYTSGQTSARVKRIELKYGRGLAGLVIRLGRPVTIDPTDSGTEDKRLQFTIMIAEKLISAAAVPVVIRGETRGVLLAGSRSERVYTQEDVNTINRLANQLADKLIESEIP